MESPQSSALLPLVKRLATPTSADEHARPRRDRHLAPTMRRGGRPLRASDFSVGEEILVPRQHDSGETFQTWCRVTRVVRDKVFVDVPKEGEQAITMMLLQRLAEQLNEGSGGALLSEVRRLTAENARLTAQLHSEQRSRELRTEQSARSRALVAVAPMPSVSGWSDGYDVTDEVSTTTAIVPWEPPQTASRARAQRRRATTVVDASDGVEEQEEEELEEVGVTSGWEKLELRCAVTWQRLTDPAKLSGCAHAAKTNYEALRNSGTVCPVLGCTAQLRQRNIVRDTALRTKLKRVRSGVTAVWISGDRLTTRPPGGATKLQRQL